MSDTENIFELEFDGLVLDYEGTPSAGMSDEGTLDYLPFEAIIPKSIAPKLQEEIADKELEFLQKFPQRVPEKEAREFYRRLLPGRYRLILERIKQ